MRRTPRAILLALAVTLPVGCADTTSDLLAPDDPADGIYSAPGITVMSQNMYLGANIDLLLTAESAEDVAMVFQQLTTSTLAGDFKRAQQMALQIALNRPHLVGLQEVSTYTMETPLGTEVLPFLFVLQGYLDYFHYVAQITPYHYTTVVNPLTSVYFPASMFGAFPDVTYQDADAILVRDDVTLIGDPELVTYQAREVFNVAGTAFDNVRGYIAVTADIDGHVIRFVNTHLEVQMFEETQLAQTAELIAAFEDETLPVVMVGDFNSAANHDAPEDQKTASYHVFRQAGFADLWLRGRHSVGGYTCCQDPMLVNSESELGQRLDLVLVRYGNAGFGGQSTMEVIGEEQDDRIEVLPGLTLWPSDHAAVAATFWPAPGQRKKFAVD